jgi:prepilin-type N-terminal cleavage/methylation domain-containing protein
MGNWLLIKESRCAHTYIHRVLIKIASNYANGKKNLRLARRPELDSGCIVEGFFGLLRRFSPRNDAKAFTLTEVLITLGIIGVVAAMTIPNLFKDIEDLQFKSAWKKKFSEIAQVQKKMSSDYSFPYSSQGKAYNAFQNYMNYQKFCTNPQAEGCWHQPNEWVNIYGTQIPSVLDLNSQRGYILNDGTLMFFSFYNIPASNPAIASSGGRPIVGTVDLNGYKKPNKVGKDIVSFYMDAEKTLPMGAIGTTYESDSTFCNSSGVGTSAASGISCSDDILRQ